MAASCSMKHLQDRHVSAEISKCIWSPKRDLLAVANVHGQVAIHRLSWQRVFLINAQQEGSKVTALAWRPDSKVLAIGYTSGDVVLINIEDSNVIHKLKFREEVTTLTWAQYVTQDPEAEWKEEEDPWMPYMTPLPSLSKSYGEAVKSDASDTWQELQLLQDQSDLTILFIGTLSASIYMHAFGLFHIGTFDIKDTHRGCSNVLNIALSQNLGVVSVTLLRSRDSDVCDVSHITLDTHILASRHRELCLLSQKYGQIYSLVSYIGHTIAQIEEAWESILLEMDAKLMAYASTQREGGVSADFLELLVFGYASSDFEFFLTEKLTEKGLKRLRSSVEFSYSNVQKLVVKNLQAVGQTLMFILSQVLGMSRRLDRYGLLGIKEESVVEALRAAGSFLLKAGEMQQVIESSMRDFQDFLKWVSTALLRILKEQVPADMSRTSQQEMCNIINFLSESLEETTIGPDGKKRTRFKLEKVGQYLENSDLKIPHACDKTPWIQFLRSNPDVVSHQTIFPHNSNKSLVQEQHSLTSMLTAMGAEPARAISEVLSISRCVSLVSIPLNTDPVVSQIYTPQSEHIYTVIVPKSSHNTMYLAQWPTSSDVIDVVPQQIPVNVVITPFVFSSLDQSRSFSEAFPGALLKVIDAQFYTEETLSLLLQDPKEAHVVFFVQLWVRGAAAELRPVALPGSVCFSELSVPPRDGTTLIDISSFRRLDTGPVSAFAVSGSRKVATVIGENRRRVWLFEMEVDEDDDDDENVEDLGQNESGPHDSTKTSDDLNDAL